MYGLPERYSYLPNQFWLHKNHLLVIEALALLKQAGHSIVVAASGKQIDPHKPQHFLHISEQLHAKGLVDHFRMLGLIPYEHVAPLMVGSVAVLNPSLFEGWSTTVEEARALHVPLVLSDIPVHKEQASGLARFFDRSSAESLAKALLSVWLSPGTATLTQPAPPNGSSAAVQRFAEDFLAVVHRAAAMS
jgi:glycosyltransferase involved in cell wall biosynthesis